MTTVSCRNSRRATLLALLVTTGLLTGAPAALADDASSCTAPPLSQPFLSWGDQDYYALAPGQSGAGFDGAGWTLTGDASVTTVTLPDGTTTSVLDLPSRATATSPLICVDPTYLRARAMVRNLAGAEGVSLYVAYDGTPTWKRPRNVGQIHGKRIGWTLSDRVNLRPAPGQGWRLARFTFVAGGQSSEFQIYDFYVDPYSKR